MSLSSDAVTSKSAAATATLSDPRILRGSDADLAVAAVLGADLRGGTWTRSAGGTARGDAGVETALSELADAAREAARAAGYAAGCSEGRHEAQVEADGQAADAEQQRQRARAADRARVESALSALAVAGGRTDDAA